MKLDRLIIKLNPEEVVGKTSVEIRGVASDSRHIHPGYLFVAISGRRLNGEDFITEARDRGAVGIVLREFSSSVNSNLAQVKVARPRRALSLIANELYSHPADSMKMIGVTGTNGKTTVTHLARAVFEEAGFSTGLIGTNYYGIGEMRLPAELTTPAPPQLQELLSRMKRQATSRVIMEVSSHAIAQHRLAGIEFQAAVFTNLTRDHLDYHRTMEEYGSVKTGFFRDLARGKIPSAAKKAIINIDDPLSRKIIPELGVPVMTYGVNTPADLQALKINLSRSGSSFTLCWDNSNYPVRIPLPGRHNIYNVLAVIGLGLNEGIDLPEILNSLAGAQGIKGRLEPVDTGADYDLFIDYAHTPDGMENVLGALRELRYRRIIIVFGCGGDRDRTKRPLMGEVAARLADTVIVTSDNPRSEDPEKIIEDIFRGIPRADKEASAIPDRREAIEEACRRAGSGDVVLIAGKGHEERQIFRDHIIPFSDREEAKRILSFNISSV
ncbi:MAG: UDP-N-acetylmuramoyl-L-alanyl-D-glutamate--2,6-diaminopimelate ligase [Candidatus Auribacterota bacterium]|nr:UDP-N-acetylmuramoyl-L-alanyl-D-glutamate--2,6-diaminopimelate ligase [Candidatus Auribacterota bacterium]